MLSFFFPFHSDAFVALLLFGFVKMSPHQYNDTYDTFEFEFTSV